MTIDSSGGFPKLPDLPPELLEDGALPLPVTASLMNAQIGVGAAIVDGTLTKEEQANISSLLSTALQTLQASDPQLASPNSQALANYLDQLQQFVSAGAGNLKETDNDSMFNPSMFSSIIAVLAKILSEIADTQNEIVLQSSKLKQTMLALISEYANASYSLAIQVGEQEAQQHALNAQAAMGSIIGAAVTIAFAAAALGCNIKSKGTDMESKKMDNWGNAGMFLGSIGQSLGTMVSEGVRMESELEQKDVALDKAQMQAKLDFLRQILEGVKQVMQEAGSEGSSASQFLAELFRSFTDWAAKQTQRLQ